MEKASMTTLLEDIISTSGEPKPGLVAEPELVISMRKMDMQRALSNLIENAQVFGSSIEINAQKQEDRLVILIDDDGPGIPAAQRSEAFKPFIRLDGSRNQNVKGVGLGLSIARDIIQAHGGVINLEDSPQGGLRCRVSLPL
jgi:two-component system osmolarity sensor histidine kinase EnvZ